MDKSGVSISAKIEAPRFGSLRRFFDGDVFYSFKRSPATIVAAAVFFIVVVAAAFAPWVAPHNPFDLRP